MMLTGYFDDPSVVYDTVTGAQSTVVHSLLVKVSHPSCYVGGEGEPEAPVEWNVLILEHVIETALWAVLIDDGKIW